MAKQELHWSIIYRMYLFNADPQVWKVIDASAAHTSYGPQVRINYI